MHRNSKEWSAPSDPFSMHPNDNLVNSVRAQGNLQHFSNKEPSTKTTSSYKNAGFLNKGNTCYINSILQVFSVLPSFWCHDPTQSGVISPLIRALTLNLSLLKKRSSPVDPSNFLRAFQNKISEKRGTPFNINSQQDVPEMLQFLLDELTGCSAVADGIISSSLVRTTTCNLCFCSSSNEDKHNIICLPLTNSLQASINKLLEPEHLKGSNKWFCNSCNTLQDSIRDCKFVTCGTVLIFQLNRFTNSQGNLIKDNRKVKCPSECLSIPVWSDDDLSLNRKFKLRATINHSGTLNSGHYWAFIKTAGNNGWRKCNDSTISKVSFKDLSNDSSYIFIYCAE